MATRTGRLSVVGYWISVGASGALKVGERCRPGVPVDDDRLEGG
jgi:hypothetical protein